MSRSKIILTVLVSLLSMRGAIACNLQPYEAVYETELSGFDVNIKRRLQRKDSLIIVTVDAKRFMFAVHETSMLLDEGDGLLRSRSYEHKRKGLTHKHDKDLVFDWTDTTVVDLLKPDRNPLPVEEPSYDKLGYQTQMRLDLIRNPGLQHLEYAVTNGVRNRTYTFDLLGEELLDTPLGKLRTLKFNREGDDDDREVVVWVALDWGFLLVRIDQTKEAGGKTERMVLKSAKIAGKKVVGL